jgi:L-ascorbate metabolism protein UlaG (beta-lactamase superfamily)
MWKNLFWLMSFTLFSCHSAKGVSPSDDTFTTQSGKQVKIECYRHASLCIVYDGHAIQVDPVTDKAHGVVYNNKGKADAILITHEHFDHFDKQAIAELSDAKTEIVLNKNTQRLLGKGVAMSNGDTLTLKCGVKVEAVPAYNTTPGHLQYHPQGRDNGYVLTIENLRIYIAADTEVIPAMSSLKNIDIAFMPCNQPFTMTVDQLVEAAKTVHPRILFPYHFSETNMSVLPKKLEGTGIEVRLRAME